MKVLIETEYYCCLSTEVDIPGVTSWDDIEDWFVKWGTLNYRLKGEPEEAWHEIELDSDTSDAIDWKRPSCVTVRCPDTYEVIYSDEETV